MYEGFRSRQKVYGSGLEDLLVLKMPFLASILLLGFGKMAMGANEVRQKVISAAHAILDRGDISYTFGGSQTGGVVACAACKVCLAKEKPVSKKRSKICPMCKSCSLDCSHFIVEVFKRLAWRPPTSPQELC
jgi:hypothetical protein